jgi:hypothetical protein
VLLAVHSKFPPVKEEEEEEGTEQEEREEREEEEEEGLPYRDVVLHETPDTARRVADTSSSASCRVLPTESKLEAEQFGYDLELEGDYQHPRRLGRLPNLSGNFGPPSIRDDASSVSRFVVTFDFFWLTSGALNRPTATTRNRPRALSRSQSHTSARQSEHSHHTLVDNTHVA